MDEKRMLKIHCEFGNVDVKNHKSRYVFSGKKQNRAINKNTFTGI